MYLQTSRLQYNLQKVGVYQTAHSVKIFKPKLVSTLYHKKSHYASTFLYSVSPRQRISENTDLGRYKGEESEQDRDQTKYHDR